MREYKRSFVTLMISILQYIFGGAIVGIIVGVISNKVNYAIVSFVIIEIVSLIMFLTKDNIRFELDGYTFRYFKRGKLVKEYNIKESSIGPMLVTGGKIDCFDLYIDNDVIDCEPLGKYTFIRMCEDLEEFTKEENEKVKVVERE